MSGLSAATASAAPHAAPAAVAPSQGAGAAAARVNVDPDGPLGPDIRAAAAIVYDPVSGRVIWGENADAQRSIASITKLMTAVVFVEAQFDPARKVTVAAGDVRRASITYLRRNERVDIATLLHLLLIASDNAAARVLARVSPWGSEGFIDRMNEKATELGLLHTRFTDPSGLHAGNISSALDLSKLLVYAAANEQISPIMRMAKYTVRTNRRRVTIRNTNKLLDSEFEILGGKTGFIRKAGFCLATLLQLPQGPQVAIVVLGAKSNVARFVETRTILDWLTTKAADLLVAETTPQPQ